MRSNRSRIAVAVGAIAAIVILFVVLSGGSSNNKSSTGGPAGSTAQAGGAASSGASAVINVINGKPAGGIQRLNYKKGDQVRFKVNSDVGDEIHVHGYDLHKDVKAGSSVSFSFPATIEGVFVIELEAKSEQIAELRVSPS
jgi:hypothetical protein